MNEEQMNKMLKDVEKAVKEATINNFYGNIGIRINFLSGNVKNVNFLIDQSKVY